MSEKHSALKPTIVMVGGFLGAGKTTLLLAAARELKKRNMRSALILNDQGGSLVDSALSERYGSMHGEVTGGCFCCRFSDLTRVLGDLRAFSPDIIFAEPVGSCTDISATTLQPLRACADFDLAPFTVLIDPARAEDLLRDEANVNLRYLFTKQLEEADVVCFTKSDVYLTYPDISRYITSTQIRQVSAVSGQGVAAWLDEVLAGRIRCGSHLLDIDYQQYAQAEAALAWLNLRVDLQAIPAKSPVALLGPFFDELDEALTNADIRIVHMKAIVQAGTGFVKAASCGNGQEPRVEGDLQASPASSHNLLLNLRALGAASSVRSIVEGLVATFEAERTNLRIDCFHPAAPMPEHRFATLLPLQGEAPVT